MLLGFPHHVIGNRSIFVTHTHRNYVSVINKLRLNSIYNQAHSCGLYYYILYILLVGI